MGAWIETYDGGAADCGGGGGGGRGGRQSTGIQC